MLIANPTFPASFIRSPSFVCISPCASDSRHRSSANSRSSILSTRPDLIPRHLSRVTFLITASITIKNIMGERVHPCLTLVHTGFGSDTQPSCATQHTYPR
jgi:hypothetical protein